MKQKTLQLILALVAACGPAQWAGATSVAPVAETDLVKGSELIFQGVVTKVEYKMSGVRTSEDAYLPHAFVTFQVEQIMKGRIAGGGTSLTLRFMGGPDVAGGRFLVVEGCPDFDLGERVVLFVRRNGRSLCPAVGWQQGRFRIANGGLYSESGREVWVSLRNKLALGRKQSLEEVRAHHRGGSVYAYIEDGPNVGESTGGTASPRGTRLTPAAFVNRVVGLVNTLYTASQLAALPAMQSAVASQPFYVAQPAPAGSAIGE